MTSEQLSPHAPERRIIKGAGTDERAWRESEVITNLPSFDVAEWNERYQRIWLLAPHPDDEVLALGGSLACLADIHADLRIVSITDGEASHADSTHWTRERLAQTRPIELRRALEAMNVDVQVQRLGIPDGHVGAHREELLKTLADVVDEHDLVLATCRFDGHPDHEACGEVADLVGQLTGATVYEYPVWMWHWASPGETTIPWSRARCLPISKKIVGRKRRAIAQFSSQLRPDGDREPVLPARFLPRFLRPFEVVFA
jgi:LmbE family N-acetylglucosaminyl deacetylase